MASQDMAEVVPLFGESDTADDVTVSWTPAEEMDQGAYRRLLELLFLPRNQQPKDEAA
ncbi:hypothetical protein ACIOHC_35670 [Streptomyces sp. NPDC088252]|uniref:hypothetical protein n=1 Tax=Streptomyces sp. NPDC088252 TaxID=3365845 RepID=UPI0037F65330